MKEFIKSIQELNLKQVEERLSQLDIEVREMNDVAKIEEATEQKKALLERKAELEEIEKRKSIALGLENGELEGKVIEERKDEKNMILDKENILASKEYRSAFFKTLQRKELNEAEKRAMTSASNSAGAAIPTQTANILVQKMFDVAPLLSEITLLRIAGNVTVATGLERDSAYQHAENANITASSDVLASITLAGYEFFKLVSISKTVETMSIDAFEDWLTDAIFEDIALKIENVIIYGNGSSAPGGLASITFTAGTNLISTTASISYKDICDLMTYPEKGLRKGAKFLCNSTFVYTHLAGIKDDQKRPIFVESMTDGVPSRLMGKELLISDEVNDDELYYGQFKKIFGNLSSDIAVDVSKESGFRNGTIDYRGSAIFDCKVAAPRAFGKFKKNS